MSRMERRRVTITSPRVREEMCFAIVADFHNGQPDRVLPLLQGVDAVLLPGDMVRRYDDGYQRALGFLRRAVDIAPTFYSLGNHERKLASREAYWSRARKTGVRVLDNEYTSFRGVILGGLSSHGKKEPPRDIGFLRSMAREAGFRLLLCHHPEDFLPYVAEHELDLTVAGHAHGGQWRLFGQGIYAPGQGLFPKLTNGFYFSNRLLVSRGVTNSTRVPRLFCPCEVILLHLKPGKITQYEEET